jgi:hypothetical protein
LGGLMPPGFESPALGSAAAASHLGVFASSFAPGMSGGGGNFTPGLQLAQADTVGCDVCEDPVFSAARIGAWWDFEGGFGGRRGRLRGIPAGGNPAEQEAIRRAREARANAWGIKQQRTRPDLDQLSPKIEKQMRQRGWTKEQIIQAFDAGDSLPAVNRLGGANTPATRYIHPQTGQSVVIDNVTGQIVHVGGPGFRY